MWFGVDPMAEKHPDYSPFTYTANNPIVLVDLDGKDWILSIGNKVFWYGGKTGDKSNLLYTFKATSGYKGPDINGKQWNLQKAKYQNIKDAGPTPEGKYHINLKPDPDRVAKSDPKTGELVGNPSGGIEKVPESNPVQGSSNLIYTYDDWGKNRAKLSPDNVTGAKNTERDNNSYYLHDSTKGYTHGCTEVETNLFDVLKEYRAKGNEKIDVIIKYPSNDHSTNGGTDKTN